MMKKLLSVLLATVMLLTCIPLGAVSVSAEWYDWDDAVVSGDYTYLVQDGEAVILSADESISGVVNIPSKLGGYPVTVIAEGAFKNRELMVILTIPDSVVTIEESAFENCDNLMVVTIGNGVTYIGIEAFKNCYNLETLTLGSKVETIDWGAFAWCESITSLEIPNSTVEICESNYYDIGAFEGCIALEELTFGNNLKHIGSRAFMSCSSINNITIPDGVESIGANAFGFCSALMDIDIPDSVTFMGEYAFIDCVNLITANISNNVTEIGKGTFSECEKLSSVTIGESVTSIGAAAFWGCKSLTEIVLPGSVLEVKGEEFDHYKRGWDTYGAFEYCEALQKVTFNNKLQSIGEYAFANCRTLKEIIIPDSVTEVQQFAFADCINLEKAVIGDGVTEISRAIFDSCTKLSDLTIGNAVTSINGQAFRDCVSLKTVTIPDNVVTFNSVSGHIDYYYYDNIGAFWGCSSLETVNLGKMVISISAGTFARCSSLTDINVPAENLMFSSINGVLLNRKKTAIVYCPMGKKNVGVLPESVVSVNDNAFVDCSDLSVWYAGNEEMRDAISFGNNNQSLQDAAWHYNACADEHIYTSDCDTTCNKCTWVRKTSKKHTYTNACDTKCNVCNATRTIKHSYKSATCTAPKTCKICGVTSGKKLGHTYDNACDKSCNRCKATRTIKHKYSNSCDTSCNTCKATRKITHSYKTVTKKATTTANGYTVKRCSVCKKETGKTTIYKASKISLSKTAYTYNGKAVKPTVTIKDSKGNKIASSNYTVTYASGRKNVGTYKVTIKFKGKYSGTKTLTYKINPVKTTVSKLTAAKKSLKVTITKKTTQVTGYEVQYSTSKSFKSAKTKTLTSYKKNTLTLSGLKAKTTYYVRVRTYKTVNGKKYYSAWSAAKSLKTK